MDWRKCLQITYLEKTTTENTRRSLKANSGKTNNPVRKWEKIMNIYSTKEIHVTNKAHENSSPLRKGKLNHNEILIHIYQNG